MLSSDETVTEEDVDRAGVEVGVATLTSDRALACASAWETAERYEAALAGRLDGDLDILNIECEGDAEFIAIGEGMVGGKKRKSAGLNTVQRRKRASGFVAVVCVVAVEGNRGGVGCPKLGRRQADPQRNGWRLRVRIIGMSSTAPARSHRASVSP